LGFRGTERDNCDGKENTKLWDKMLHCPEDGEKAANDLND
jgi:hypothetical protein